MPIKIETGKIIAGKINADQIANKSITEDKLDPERINMITMLLKSCWISLKRMLK